MATRPPDCPVPDEVCPADRVTHVISDVRRMAPQDLEIIEQHLGLVLTRIEDISAAALTTEDIAKAMRDGLVAALHDPATWTAAARGVQESAKREAGDMAVGALKGAAKRGLQFLLAGLLVYWLGGWALIAAVGQAVFGKGHL